MSEIDSEIFIDCLQDINIKPGYFRVSENICGEAPILEKLA